MDGREGGLVELVPRTSIVRHQAQRALQLAIGVGGTLGGLILLTSNVVVAARAGVTPTSFTPFVANLALVFGGVMFTREYRRSGSVPRIPG